MSLEALGCSLWVFVTGQYGSIVSECRDRSVVSFEDVRCEYQVNIR